MAPLAKDSVLIEMQAAENGYVVRVWKWDISPAPVPYRRLDDTSPEPSFRRFVTAADKTALKNAFANFVDNNFDA